MKHSFFKRLFVFLLCFSALLCLGLPASAEDGPAQEEARDAAEIPQAPGEGGPCEDDAAAAGATAPDEPAAVSLNYGYYLIGRYGWTVNDLNESRDKFQQNYSASTEEYKLSTTLAEGQQIKVVLVSNGSQLGPWYPDGDNYTVDASHAGNKVVYFRPNYNSDWAEFGGYFYIADPPTYRVNVNQPLHGVLVPNKTDAAEGETITVEAIPDPGYYPAMQMKASPYPADTQWPDAFHFSFTMPGYDVTVSIGWNQMCVDGGYYYSNGKNVMDLTPEDKFLEQDSPCGEFVYEGTLAEGQVFHIERILTAQGWSSGGSIWNPDITAEMAGHARIYLSRTEREGYTKVFELLPYVQGTEDLWVGFRYAHPITVESAAHGTVTAPQDAFAGDAVTLNITHEDGYALDTVSVTDENGVPVEVINNSFVMPDSPVTVSASFKQDAVYTITLVGAGEGVTIRSTKETAQEGDTVDVTVTTDSNHRFISITVTDEQGTVIETVKRPDGANKYRFTMPASHVTVTVVTKTIYPLYLINTQVDSLNCQNILGDGTVSYDPDTRTLSFSSAEPAFGTDYGNALIYWTGEDCLTVEAPQGLHLAGATSYCAYAASGDLVINGDLFLDIPQDSNGVWCMKNLTINGNVSGTVKAIALYGLNSLTVNGSVNLSNQDSIRVAYSTGEVYISGDFSATGYGIDAAGGITVGGNVTIASSATAGNYGLQSGGAVSVGGSFDFSGKALCAVSAAGGFRCEDSVTLVNSSGKGIYSANGPITVVSGSWDVQAASDPLKAAAGILIPAGHEILLPEGGETATLNDGGNEYTVVYEADGTTPATHVVIGPSALSGFHIILNDYTNGLAGTSIDAAALYSGAVTFTVSSGAEDKAVAAAVVNADGTLTRLDCTTADGLHSFTVAVTDADVTVALLLKGDFDLNGRIQNKDSTMAKQVLVGLKELPEETAALQIFAVDLNNDGRLQNKETTMVSQVIVESKSYAW